jgi:hypothetical protein
MKRHHLYCSRADVDRLDTRAKVAATAASAWAAPWLDYVAEAHNRVERDLRDKEYKQARAAATRAGEIARTRQDLLRQGLRRHIAEQGWRVEDWPPVPAGAAPEGRPWGAEHRGWNLVLDVYLDDADSDLITRVGFATSKEPRAKLIAWADIWGTGQDAPQAAIAERDQLRAQLLTTSDILREVLALVIGDADVIPAGCSP